MSRHQLKPQPTAAERIAAKRKLAEAPRKDYYQLQKYAGLSYDYGQIAEADRELVQQAALDIHRWQKDTLALGNTLLAVKERLPHRQFLEWLRVEFDSGLRVLQQSMNVARMLKDDPKAHDRALLSADALYLLAAPSTPETVRWEVFERMEMLGHRPTRAQIKEIIDAHRPPRPKQLPGPVAEPEPDAIEAEYTVLASATVHPALSRALALKVRDGLLHRIFRGFLTDDERDELLVALSQALKGYA